MDIQDKPSYEICANHKLVLGISPFHIPFELNKSKNKDEIISFRNDLRRCIKELIVPDGKNFFCIVLRK